MVAKKLIHLIVAATLTSLSLATFGPFGSTAATAQTTPIQITVAPMTPSPMAWTPYFIAKPLGFYAAEGLDVDVIKNPPRGSQTSMLLTGKIAFAGISSVTNMPQNATLGKLKWFMGHEMFPFKIMVLDSSPIKSVKELRGKTIGMRSVNDEPAAKLMLAGGGVKPSEFKTLVVGAGVPGGAALQRASADAIMGTVVDQIEIGASGIKLREIDLDNAAGLYNGGLMATTDELAKNKDIAIRFGRAVAKAYIWTYENPDAALDLLAKVVPEAVQDRAVIKRLLLALNDSNRARYEARFRADPAVYQRQIDLEAEIGVIDRSFPASEVFTNDLLDQIWNFDVEAVKKEARSGKY